MTLESKNIRYCLQEEDDFAPKQKVGVGYNRPWRKAMSKNVLNQEIYPVSVSSVSPIPPKNMYNERGMVRDISAKNVSQTKNLVSFDVPVTKRTEVTIDSSRPAYRDYLSEMRM
jgi:hypothetical protein